MIIFDLIPTGKDNAVSKAALMETTGLPERTVRLMVAKERQMGKIILTDCGGAGYYRPSNTADTVRFIRSMRGRAAEINAVADATERALLEEIGQEHMEGWQ